MFFFMLCISNHFPTNFVPELTCATATATLEAEAATAEGEKARRELAGRIAVVERANAETRGTEEKAREKDLALAKNERDKVIVLR